MPATGSGTESKVRHQPSHIGRPRDSQLGVRIMRAALEQVVEGGLQSLTMDAVAKRVGAGKASLYRRWDSRDALLASALIEFSPSDVVIDTGSLREDLIAVYVHYSGGSDGLVRAAVIDYFFNFKSLSPWLDEEMPDWIEGRRRGVIEIIERATQRGELDRAALPDLDMFLDLMPSMMLFRQNCRDQVISDEMITEIVDQVLLPLLLGRAGA